MPLPSFDPRMLSLLSPEPKKKSVPKLLLGKRLGNDAAWKGVQRALDPKEKIGLRQALTIHDALMERLKVPQKDRELLSPAHFWHLDPPPAVVPILQGRVSTGEDTAAQRGQMPCTARTIAQLSSVREEAQIALDNEDRPALVHALKALPYSESASVRDLIWLVEHSPDPTADPAFSLLGLKAVNCLLAAVQSDLSHSTLPVFSTFVEASNSAQVPRPPIGAWLERIGELSFDRNQQWLTRHWQQTHADPDSARQQSWRHRSGKLMPYAKAFGLVDQRLRKTQQALDMKLGYVAVVYAHNVEQLRAMIIDASPEGPESLTARWSMFDDFGLMTKAIANFSGDKQALN